MRPGFPSFYKCIFLPDHGQASTLEHLPQRFHLRILCQEILGNVFHVLVGSQGIFTRAIKLAAIIVGTVIFKIGVWI